MEQIVRNGEILNVSKVFPMGGSRMITLPPWWVKKIPPWKDSQSRYVVLKLVEGGLLLKPVLPEDAADAASQIDRAEPSSGTSDLVSGIRQ